MDLIERQDAIDAVTAWLNKARNPINQSKYNEGEIAAYETALSELKKTSSAQPDLGKYEYHYDHTDCIWYQPGARNRCPVTCAQYRDGWNDAMQYIFRGGDGYRPYRRDERYEE